MKNYTILLSLLVILLSAQIATSQKQSKNRNSNSIESIEKQMIKIQEKLGLDGLQAVLVERILQKYVNEKKQLRRNQSDSGDVIRAKMRDMNMQRNDELSEILTEEQLALLNKIFKEQSSQRNSQSKKGSGKGSGKRKGKGNGLRSF